MELAAVAVFTPWELANALNQGFLFLSPRENRFLSKQLATSHPRSNDDIATRERRLLSAEVRALMEGKL